MLDFGKYYRGYRYMQDILKDDYTYNYIRKGLAETDDGNDKHYGKNNEKVIDMDWVVAIEEALPYIQKAIDEQRRFIKREENVVRIELAKKVGPESVKHLSQHTNFIAKVEDGFVTPNKILTVENEETYATYENRVLITLVRKALFFVDDKYSRMKDVPDKIYNKMILKRHVTLNDRRVHFNFEYSNRGEEVLADNLDVLDVEELSDFDRIRRIRITLNSFLQTDLMKAIAKEPEVRPPLTQTNLLKKNPNFKKAVELWTFLDSYKKPGFDVVSEDYQGEMGDEITDDVYFAVGFEHFLMSISTNPSLRKLLEEKYQEENRRIAEEEKRPDKITIRLLKEQIEEIRKEEMEIRMREIREREKKILDLTNEIKALKNTLEQKEQQILTLKGKVSMLEDEIAELKEELKVTKLKLLEAENKIKELEAENAMLKAKVAELEAHIEELNNTIDTLNKEIETLNHKIEELEAENAQLKEKIAEQEQIIEEQKERISALEAQVAEQLATIAALTENLEKCKQKIAEDEAQIADLTEKNTNLTNTLETERRENAATIAKMNADFQAQTIAAEEKHNAEMTAEKKKFDDAQLANKQYIEKLNADFAAETKAAEERHYAEINDAQKRFDEAQAANSEVVAKLNADFAEQTSKLEQKHIASLADQQKNFDKQVEKIKQSNASATAASDAKHASEIRKVQKSVDKRVAEAEKSAEKRFNDKVSAIKKQAQSDIKKAEKKASDKAASAREEAKSIKGSVDLFARDYSLGSIEVVSAFAEKLAVAGTLNLAAQLVKASKQVKSLFVNISKKDVILSDYSPSGTRLIKKYKKTSDLTIAVNDLNEQLGNISDSPVCITYSGVDAGVAAKFAETIGIYTTNVPVIRQNKSIKSDGFVAVYYSKE